METEMKERDENLVAFGDNLRRIRVGHRYTQERLAQACGISREYLSRMENGVQSATVGMCFRLAAELGLHISDLFIDLE